MSTIETATVANQASLIAIVWWGGLILVLIGLLKIAVYFVGARCPGWIGRIKSPTLRRFLAGRSNRLVFGWGGFITAAIGFFFMGASRVMAHFADRLGHL